MGLFSDDIQMKPEHGLLLDLAVAAGGFVTKEGGDYFLNFDRIDIFSSGPSTIKVAFLSNGKSVSSVEFSGGSIPVGRTYSINGIEGRTGLRVSKA
jgi:hypothetical protein